MANEQRGTRPCVVVSIDRFKRPADPTGHRGPVDDP
ncbi:MAG: hypothetical protein ACRDSZ_19530 [Pseudonocardiaceae bacterium]